uniref:NAD(P)(+) transhydrogenase (Si-specific) n=1 Tax=Eutreptiella gymnastica TaxID=73025 RepID=A0A6U8N6N8_9EUGL|mmetsp:Transcript_88188/g.153214  ORF Transcript_88188/g.153214 Transcript_88188/m.153214 type:complete len:746 (+) Transcript_88188:24-2261(+)
MAHTDNARNGLLLGGALLAATGLWLAATTPNEGTRLFTQVPAVAIRAPQTSVTTPVVGPYARADLSMAAAPFTADPMDVTYAQPKLPTRSTVPRLSTGPSAPWQWLVATLSAAAACSAFFHWLGRRMAQKDAEYAPFAACAAAGKKEEVEVRTISFKKAPTKLMGGAGNGNVPDLNQYAFPKAEGEYDLVVVGAGPGGEATAVAASRFGARVAIIESRRAFGGPTGLTSKAVREAAKQISATCDALGGNRRLQMKMFWQRNFAALRSEAEVAQAAESRGRLQRSGVDLYISDKTILDIIPDPDPADLDKSHKVTVTRPKTNLKFGTRNICIATGSRAARPDTVPFMKDRIVDSTEICSTLAMGLPKTCGIIGGGIIAVEYATVLASVGVGITIFCNKDRFMTMLPRILRESLLAQLNNLHILLVEDEIDSISPGETYLGCKPRDMCPSIKCKTKSGSTRMFKPELILYSGGRDANSEGLNLAECGIKFAKYGRIAVNDNYETNMPGVFAVGDVIGGGLASAAAQGGRTVSTNLFAPKAEQAELQSSALFGTSGASSASGGQSADVPLTLWTIPEIASVGVSVEQLEAQGETGWEDGGNIIVGYARFDELARGRLAGGQGFVQIVAMHTPAKDGQKAATHRIVGVHIIGSGANELIALGALMVTTNTACETITNTPFAAVTLTQLFQLATDDALCNSPYNAMSKLRATKVPLENALGESKDAPEPATAETKLTASERRSAEAAASK